MINIVIVRPPVCGSMIYVNPYNLQELFAFLSVCLWGTASNIVLIDCHAGDAIPIIGQDTVLFVDTPDGSQEYIASDAFRALVENCKFCFLTGAITNYGDGFRLAQSIHCEKCGVFRYDDFEALFRVVGNMNNANLLRCIHGDHLPIVPSFSFSKSIVSSVKLLGDRFHVPAFRRGCEYSCSFCHININKGAKLVKNTMFNLGHWLADLQRSVHEAQFDIQFVDENFLGRSTYNDVSSIVHIVSEFNSVRRIGIDARCDSIVNNKDSLGQASARELLLDEYIQAGLDYIYLGIESFSESQLKRYGKQFSKNNALSAIERLKCKNIKFTIGMILFDPLVTKYEIKETMLTIRRLNLQSHVASLLKEMRCYIFSPYTALIRKYDLLSSKCPDDDYLKLRHDFIRYKDPVIDQNISIIRLVSWLFRNGGYRHSDIARTMHGDLVGSVVVEVHNIVVEMELAIIEDVVFSDDAFEYKFTRVADRIATALNSIREKIDSNEWTKDCKIGAIGMVRRAIKNIALQLDELTIYKSLGNHFIRSSPAVCL